VREPPGIPYTGHDRGKDGTAGIAEPPVEAIGSHSIDAMAVGAAEAFYPEGPDKAFEIPLDIPVSPDAPGPAGQAAWWPGPGVFLAELK